VSSCRKTGDNGRAKRRRKGESVGRKTLKSLLDQLTREFDLRHISPDPVEIVHEYRAPEDQEVVAFVAAALAYGNVWSILRSVRRVLGVLGDSPRAAVLALNPRKALDRLSGFRHRFNSGVDVARLLLMTGRALRRHGSLGTCFAQGYRETDPNIGPALERFVAHMLGAKFPDLDRVEKRTGSLSRVDFLLPLPSRGSACKRLNLFLRWMVRRRDGVDFGLWPQISPAKLIIPLDTHVARISRGLGLTRRAAAGWKTACEITEALKRLDPLDPVRYDFAISRLGILGYCRRNAEAGKCSACPLARVCTGPNGRAVS